MAERERLARPGRTTALRRPAVQCQLARLEVAPRDEVDDAGDGVAPVQGRCAVLEDLDALDGGQRNRVQVDARSVERIVGQASSVQQHQGSHRPEPPQRCGRLARRAVVSDAQRLRRAIGVGGQLADELLRGLHAAVVDLLAPDDLDRQGRLGVDAADARPDDLDLLCLVIGHVLRVRDRLRYQDQCDEATLHGIPHICLNRCA